MKTENEDIYLIVLSHGLWGNKNHMSFLEQRIRDKYKDIHILNSSVNEAKYSYDGIDICGERLAEEIESTVVRLGKNGKNVKKMSLIGYSLGGLITRYAIGVLGQKGVFNSIEPEYFITFATPHMGVKLPSHSLFSTVFKFVSGHLVSRSGDQLQLRDSYEKYDHKPLLEALSDPNLPYAKYLSKFKTRRTYANVANDRTVPYWSSGIEIKDYFYDNKGKIDISLDDKYISIITGFDIRTKSNKSKEKRNVTKYAFYLLYPILAPVFLIVALSVIGIQGAISRIRVHQLTTQQQKLMITSRRSSADYVEGELLTGALDAVNNLPESPMKHTHTSEHTAYYPVAASKALEAISTSLKFDDISLRIHQHLHSMNWERVYVYIQGFNAHGSIVCRQKRFTNEGGKATIQHFLDTTQFSL